jgi:hypothetical protein
VVKIILLSIAFYFFIKFLIRIGKIVFSTPPQKTQYYQEDVEWQQSHPFYQDSRATREKDISDRAKIIED